MESIRSMKLLIQYDTRDCSYTVQCLTAIRNRMNAVAMNPLISLLHPLHN